LATVTTSVVETVAAITSRVVASRTRDDIVLAVQIPEPRQFICDLFISRCLWLYAIKPIKLSMHPSSILASFMQATNHTLNNGKTVCLAIFSYLEEKMPGFQLRILSWANILVECAYPNRGTGNVCGWGLVEGSVSLTQLYQNLCLTLQTHMLYSLDCTFKVLLGLRS
jgi:hypothetical protein